MKLVTAALLPLALFCMAGCGGGSTGGEPVYAVTGNIKMNGAVLPDATVIFSPMGEQPTATGKTDAEGNFNLTTYEFADGAAAGSYKVIVSKNMMKSGGEASEGLQDDGHEQKAAAASSHSKKSGAVDGVNLVPEKYSTASSSPLDAEVKADGENNFSFTISP